MDKFRAAVRRLSEEIETKNGESLLQSDAMRDDAKHVKERKPMGPVSSLLGDACKLAGFSYAEVWIRKDESQFVLDMNQLNQAGRRLEAGEIEMRPIDPSTRSVASLDVPGTGTTRRVFRGNSIELGDIPSAMDDEPRPTKSFKLQRQAVSYDAGRPGESQPEEEENTEGEEDIFKRARSNFGQSFKDMKKVLSPELTFETSIPRPSTDLSTSLTFTGQSYFNREKFKRDPQLCRELETLIADMQSDYEDHRQSLGQGIAGHVWARAPAVDINDLSKFHLDNEEQDKTVHADPHTEKVADAFDFAYGVPVLDIATQSEVVAVMVMYHFKGESITRSDLESPAIHAVMLHVAGMIPLALELEHLLPDFRKSIGEVTEKRLLEKHPQAPAEPEHQMMTWERYKIKFGGVPGAKPQAGNDLKYSLFAAAGSFLAIVAVTSTDDYFTNKVKFRGREMFALVGSFGAVAALLFAAPQSPVSQPRNIILGHMLCCVIAIFVDYFTSTEYLPILPQWFANALAPALGIAAMSYTGWTHPPAAACATVYISGGAAVKNLHWLFLLFPVMYDCVVMIVLAVFVNNIIPSRQYPMLW